MSTSNTSQGPYQLGDLIMVWVQWTEPDDVTPIEPTTTVLNVQYPDGTQVQYSGSQIVQPGGKTGYWQYGIAAAETGWYVTNWVASGSVELSTGDNPFEVQETVFA